MESNAKHFELLTVNEYHFDINKLNSIKIKKRRLRAIKY